MIIAALCITVKNWKQSRRPSTGEQINKAFNKKKQTTDTWVDLKHIMLNERNQKQKSGYCMSPFIRKSKNR